ncbi:Ankyrin repeat and zinc finger domain-containing protein [Perkinsela sp. CCAP 1560/4]|nr:Ankyrin repeat and zinc finger domain-containing protein [Perkinsela sp. CCAP 1560/4]KNH05676.1 Ankyrin repeat and zinc finger domain-containing protein [Perkinsela sp. CCAP 1560/4]|eukprot:KNH03948.1 Ankyrin repeat and zinc finger domain-containing protein [Perkinsela sp. CCAP 1560/4]
MYENELAELRKAQHERFKRYCNQTSSATTTKGPERPADHSHDMKAAVKFQQKYGYTGNGGIADKKQPTVVKNARVVSLALQAKDAVSSTMKAISDTLLGRNADIEDEKIIQKLRKAEIQTAKNRQQRRKMKKTKQVGETDDSLADPSPKDEKSSVSTVSTSRPLFSVVPPINNPSVLEDITRITGGGEYSESFHLLNRDAFCLYVTLKDSKKDLLRRPHKFPTFVSDMCISELSSDSTTRKDIKKNRKIKISCFTTIEKKSSFQLKHCVNHILKGDWYASFPWAHSESSVMRYYYDQSRSCQTCQHFFIEMSSTENHVSSHKLTLRLGIPNEMARITIGYSKMPKESDPTVVKGDHLLEASRDSHPPIKEKSRYAELSKEKGQLFMRSLAEIAYATQIIILLRAGEAAFAVFQNSKPVFSKVIKKYVTRKSQGYAQMKSDGSLGGMSASKIFEKPKKAHREHSSCFDEIGTDPASETEEHENIRLVRKKTKAGGRLPKGSKSVGSQIRRAQFVKFIEDAQALLATEEWIGHVMQAKVVWIASSNPSLTHRIFHSAQSQNYIQLAQSTGSRHPTDHGCILLNDPKVRRVHLSTHRPSFTETCRCFVELNSLDMSLMFEP